MTGEGLSSSELIYRSIMRSGGEPFGRPYAISFASLTEKVVTYFKQKGFFSFETFESPKAIQRPNRFSRYGATNHRGGYNLSAARKAKKTLEDERKKADKTPTKWLERVKPKP